MVECFQPFYLSYPLSNKITRFTTNTLSGALIYWKYEHNKLLQFRMIYENLHLLQFMVQ